MSATLLALANLNNFGANLAVQSEPLAANPNRGKGKALNPVLSLWEKAISERLSVLYFQVFDYKF